MADIKYIIPFTKGWEGGKSNDPKDTASANPSPWTWTNPKTGYTGPLHTNKGVTYPAFASGAKDLGYQNTKENFFEMPDNIWLKIAKKKYWDKIGLDNYKSQAVANLMFSWVWGSWLEWQPRMERYLKTKGINWTRNNFGDLANNLNSLVAKEGEKKIFDELVQQKKEYLLSLKGTKANPVTDKYPQGVYTDGWMNRLKDLQKIGYDLLGKTITDIGTGLQNNAGKIIVFFFALSLLAGGIVLYNNKG